MTTATMLYGSVTTHTITLASLASDTALIAGRNGTAINNGSAGEDAIDAMLGGKVTTGTTPTNGKQIEIWCYGTWDGGTTYSAGVTGTDANFSPTGEKTLMRLVTMIPTDGTSDHGYEWGPFSVASVFGGVMPEKWGVYIVHNTAVALNATAGNFSVKHTPIKFESA